MFGTVRGFVGRVESAPSAVNRPTDTKLAAARVLDKVVESEGGCFGQDERDEQDVRFFRPMRVTPSKCLRSSTSFRRILFILKILSKKPLSLLL
jgi:hypothetical protein